MAWYKFSFFRKCDEVFRVNLKLLLMLFTMFVL